MTCVGSAQPRKPIGKGSYVLLLDHRTAKVIQETVTAREELRDISKVWFVTNGCLLLCRWFEEVVPGRRSLDFEQLGWLRQITWSQQVKKTCVHQFHGEDKYKIWIFQVFLNLCKEFFKLEFWAFESRKSKFLRLLHLGFHCTKQVISKKVQMFGEGYTDKMSLLIACLLFPKICTWIFALGQSLSANLGFYESVLAWFWYFVDIHSMQELQGRRKKVWSQLGAGKEQLTMWDSCVVHGLNLTGWTWPSCLM